MVSTPTGIDLMFDRAVGESNCTASSLPVSALVDNTTKDIEFLHEPIDLLDNSYPGVDGVPNEDLVEALGNVSETLRENLTEIVTQHPLIYSDTLIMYHKLTASEWKQVFGDSPPAPLDSWEPIWEFGETQFVVGYQTNADGDRDHSASLEPFNHILDDPEQTILPLRITPALALSEVGTMSLPQAQAYVLHQWGYDTSEIAELINKKPGTVSSHLTRGRKKATQAAWMAEFTTDIQTVTPRDYQHIFDRVGNTYYFDEDKEYYRVQGVYDDDGEFVYKLLCEHESRYVSVDYFVENAEQIHKSSLDKLPPIVQNADVMDTNKLTE